MMMKLGWLALEGLLIGFFAYFGSGAALALAVLMLLIPLCTLPVNLYLRKHLSVGLEAKVSQRKGDEESMTVELGNPTILPALRVRCDVAVRNQLNRQSQTLKVITCVFPGKTQRNTIRVESAYCGRVRVGVSRVVLYDCFGLIGIPCGCEAVTHITVQPDTFEPAVTLISDPTGADDGETYAQDRPGRDLTETYQIREYVPGDSIRQIHWKLSSKFDRLIVRDPALPIERNVLVFWERTGERGDAECIDVQAEVVVSLCRSLMDSGIQFTLGWNDTDRNLCVLHEIHDMDELVGIIPRLLRAAGAKDGVSGASLLVQTRPEALCAHMVYIAEEPQHAVMEMQRFGHVTTLACGKNLPDGAILFTPEDYTRKLMQIEI